MSKVCPLNHGTQLLYIDQGLWLLRIKDHKSKTKTDLKSREQKNNFAAVAINCLILDYWHLSLKYFFMLALQRKKSFLTTFNDLYFGHHFTHFTNYNLFTCWTSVVRFHVLHLHLSFWVVGLHSIYQSMPLPPSQHGLVNQLLIFIEKFSPMRGFEPQTSQVPSRCTTNWAIQAWSLK